MFYHIIKLRKLCKKDDKNKLNAQIEVLKYCHALTFLLEENKKKTKTNIEFILKLQD